MKDRSNSLRENWKKNQKSTFTIHARNFVMAEWLAVSFTRFCMYGHRSFFVLISLQEIVNCINDNGQNCETKNDAKFLICKWIVWKVWFFFHRQVCKKVFTFFKFVSLFNVFKQVFLNGSETSETLLLAELYVAKLSLKCRYLFGDFCKFLAPFGHFF